MRQNIAIVLIELIIGASLASASLAADASSGKALYEKSCAGCHGADGKGNEKMATVLGVKELSLVGKETKNKSDDELLKTIAEGRGKMPASKYTKEEQKQVLGYVRSLSK
jgi:mono/diheme cytochrome c family protein